jgi:hypothetical protein
VKQISSFSHPAEEGWSSTGEEKLLFHQASDQLSSSTCASGAKIVFQQRKKSPPAGIYAFSVISDSDLYPVDPTESVSHRWAGPIKADLP